MAVFPHEIHTNIATIHDAFELFKNFADANGWTIQTYHKNNVSWRNDGGFGFQTGGVNDTESYIQLESPGYGAQTLHFRIRVQNTLADPLSEFIQMNGFVAGATGVDTSSSIHPVSRCTGTQTTPWTNSLAQNTSFKPTSIDKIWIAGDATFLILVMQCSPTIIQTLMFGSHQLANPAEPEGNFSGASNASGSQAATFAWYNTNNVLPLDRTSDFALYDGNRATLQNNLTFQTNGTPTTSQAPSYARAIVPNTYTSVRPARRPDIFIQRDSDSRFIELGKIPLYRIDVSGYTIGQKIKYGATDEYLVFPALYDTRTKGFGIKIA